MLVCLCVCACVCLCVCVCVCACACVLLLCAAGVGGGVGLFINALSGEVLRASLSVSRATVEGNTAEGEAAARARRPSSDSCVSHLAGCACAVRVGLRTSFPPPLFAPHPLWANLVCTRPVPSLLGTGGGGMFLEVYGFNLTRESSMTLTDLMVSGNIVTGMPGGGGVYSR